MSDIEALGPVAPCGCADKAHARAIFPAQTLRGPEFCSTPVSPASGGEQIQVDSSLGSPPLTFRVPPTLRLLHSVRPQLRFALLLQDWWVLESRLWIGECWVHPPMKTPDW